MSRRLLSLVLFLSLLGIFSLALLGCGDQLLDTGMTAPDFQDRNMYTVSMKGAFFSSGAYPFERGMPKPLVARDNIPKDKAGLSFFLDKGPLILVLLRGFNDDDSNSALEQLLKGYTDFTGYKANVVVVVRGKPVRGRMAFWERYERYFWCLADYPDASKRTLVGNLYKQQLKVTRGGMMPAVFIIGQNRKIAMAYYAKKSNDFPSNETILKFLEAIK